MFPPARRWFHLPADVECVHADALAFLRSTPRQWSAVAVDVFQGATAGFGGVAFLESIPVPPTSCAIALNPITNRAYVAGGTRPTLTVIDVIRNRGAKTRPISRRRRAGVNEVAVDPSVGRVYVTDRESDRLTVLDEKAL